MTRIAWEPVLARAAEIAAEYRTPVTLRQLHYRLVSEPELGYPNTEYSYKHLSQLTAVARRDGKFPGLADLTRAIATPLAYESPMDALQETVATYRRDRTEGQEVVPLILAEKATLVAQLRDWFSEPLGIPVAALRGYHSESQEPDPPPVWPAPSRCSLPR